MPCRPSRQRAGLCSSCSPVLYPVPWAVPRRPPIPARRSRHGKQNGLRRRHGCVASGTSSDGSATRSSRGGERLELRHGGVRTRVASSISSRSLSRAPSALLDHRASRSTARAAFSAAPRRSRSRRPRPVAGTAPLPLPRRFPGARRMSPGRRRLLPRRGRGFARFRQSLLLSASSEASSAARAALCHALGGCDSPASASRYASTPALTGSSAASAGRPTSSATPRRAAAASSSCCRSTHTCTALACSSRSSPRAGARRRRPCAPRVPRNRAGTARCSAARRSRRPSRSAERRVDLGDRGTRLDQFLGSPGDPRRRAASVLLPDIPLRRPCARRRPARRSPSAFDGRPLHGAGPEPDSG